MPNKTHTYNLDLTYDTIHNITRKNQLHTIVQPSTTAITQKKTTYDFTYQYSPSGVASVRPHAPIHIGERAYTYDANGNQLGWTHDQNGTRRTIVWDDENRIQSLFDNGHEKTYKYDDQGQRIIKRGPQGETVYVNQFYTQRPGATGTKHVYAGKTRIASKLLRQNVPNANPNGNTPFEKDLYFYHPDHLGTSSYITDLNGKLYEHLEYFPFGEAWVEENSNQQRTPYLFTAKELDEETGLYYFGARYYDPRTSVWQSTDPILGRYLAGGPVGGVYNSKNLGLYSYSFLSPVKYFDPDGRYGEVGHRHTPQAAALAAGLSVDTARAIGAAAWAPDEDHRNALSWTSNVTQFTTRENKTSIHMLTGGAARDAQKEARQKFQAVVDSMAVNKPRFGPSEQDDLHAFGDSFAHENKGTMYGSAFGHLWHSFVDLVRGVFGLPPKYDPDNPYTGAGRYESYLGGLYDAFRGKAEGAGLSPRMSRQEFIEAGMSAATGTHKEKEQKANMDKLINSLEAE
jgi:RHS repeat-associated protein